MYGPYLVRLRVHDGVESMPLELRWVMQVVCLNSYVCHVIMLIHSVACVMCTMHCSVQHRVDEKSLVLSVTVSASR